MYLGSSFAFFRWKGKIYRQLFFVTTANASPNLLSRESCYTLGFKIVDEVPADLNTEDKFKDHLQDHLQDTNGPFPGLAMAYNGNQPNFKSPTSLQMDTWKKGLEAVLQPNSTLVITASTRSEKEVVLLQNSTLVMFESKTSTGSEETRSSERNMQEYRTSSNLHSFQTMFPELEHPALQTGYPVAPALHGTGMSTERQDIASSSQSSFGVTQPSIPAVMYPIRRHDVPYQQQRGHCAKYPACPMCPVCSNIEQCVYISDVNSAEMVVGVSFQTVCVMSQP